MQQLYPKLKEADILVLATPVYIPLPGDMQNLINRLCPLIVPLLEFREGRTRAKFREDVGIQRIALVSTSGWWEKGNFDTVIRIVDELAEDASVQFAGSVLRPHAFLLKKENKLTQEGEVVLQAVRRAGIELVNTGMMSEETLDAVSQPLISEEGLRKWYNKAL
jgi:multimeric flavodoxin WrbA